jgi:hypothetical protein
VSVVLMLALLAAGVSIGLFTVIVAIGMIASAFFSERSRKQFQGPFGGNGPIDSPRATSTDHPYPDLEAQGTLPKARVLICRIDTGGKSLPIYFHQRRAPTTPYPVPQSIEGRAPGRCHRGPPVAHRAPAASLREFTFAP